MDTDIAHDLLRQVTVGQLVTATQTGPVATLMPWVPDLDSGSLVGLHTRAENQEIPTTPSWVARRCVRPEGFEPPTF